MTSKTICLTPVKNEDWILPTFLTQASKWADHIIIADQNSTDDSVKIAQKFPKVTLVKNTSDSFNEPDRQKLLITAAREIRGPKVLITLDADEVFTPNLSSPEWTKIKSLPPGTVIKFPWCNLPPDKKTFWYAPQTMPFGFVDDGASHIGQQIHSTRIPFPPHAPIYTCNQIKVLHLQYLDWARMQSKHRWYQAYEIVTRARRDFVSLYRQYHHMDLPQKLHSIPKAWLPLLPSIHPASSYWWDTEVTIMLQTHTSMLNFADVWDFDHPQVPDGRRFYHHLFLSYLKNTQSHSGRFDIALIDRVLNFLLGL